MASSRGVRGQAGFVTTPLTLAVAGVLVLAVCGLTWVALHPPRTSSSPKLVLPATPPDKQGKGSGTAANTGNASGATVPVTVQDANARMRLRYAWLAATDFARKHHESYSGLTPADEVRLLRVSGVEMTLQGEGRLVLTKFDRASRATWGVVSIRIANGKDLLLVTRSKSGHAYCFVQRGPSTGIGAGDTHSLGACAVRWG
jgi:hypothetical protein